MTDMMYSMTFIHRNIIHLTVILSILSPTHGWSVWPVDPFESQENEIPPTFSPSSNVLYHDISQTMTIHLETSKSWTARMRDSPRLEVFCHEQEPKTLMYFWTTLRMHVIKRTPSKDGEDLEGLVVFHGENETVVRKQYDSYNTRLVYIPSLLSDSQSSFSFHVFKTCCVGISFKGNMVLQVNRTPLSIPWFTVTILGIILFFLAPKLGQNSVLYYSSSVTTGILASIIILVYVLHKFLPKKLASFALFMGSSATLLIYKLLWSHFETLAKDYYTFLSCYVIFAALVSFAVSYYFGPPTSPRAHSLIQWFIQLVAILFIFCSSYHTEGVVTIILSIITAYNIPYKIIGIYITWAKCFWKSQNDKSRSVNYPLRLSEDEYTMQGDIETEKALKDLRHHCKSRESNAWKMMSAVKDPARFVKFVEGDPHVSDEEVSEYEESFRSRTFSELKFNEDMMTDDEDEENDILPPLKFDDDDETEEDSFDDNDSQTPTSTTSPPNKFPKSIKRISPIPGLPRHLNSERTRNISGNSNRSNVSNSSQMSRRSQK